METIDASNMNDTEPAKRTTFLTVLCILTFISTGLGCLFSLIMPLLADTLTGLLQNSPNYDEVKMADSIKVFQAGWGYYAPAFLLALLSLVGALLMWKLKKTGFHLYTASNLALLFVPKVVLDLPLSIWAVVFTIGFIIMYAANFKHLS